MSVKHKALVHNYTEVSINIPPNDTFYNFPYNYAKVINSEWGSKGCTGGGVGSDLAQVEDTYLVKTQTANNQVFMIKIGDSLRKLFQTTITA